MGETRDASAWLGWCTAQQHISRAHTMDIARDGIVGLTVDETQPHEMDEPRHEMQVFASFFFFIW